MIQKQRQKGPNDSKSHDRDKFTNEHNIKRSLPFRHDTGMTSFQHELELVEGLAKAGDAGAGFSAGINNVNAAEISGSHMMP